MENNKVFGKVFMWMFIGLLITFLTGYVVSSNDNMLYNIFSGGTYFILIIIELVLVVYLSARIHKMQVTTARIVFILYSFVSGLTFGSIFIVFKMSSIMLIFLITAILFGIFALIGRFTKLDLTKAGTILLMMLLGIVICTFVNVFLKNDTLDLFVSYISIIVFLGFTAYDMQKIKMLSYEFDDEDKIAIIGALELYLDFINVFIDLLRIFGKRD
jgi:FtsH-binding integral membrane protein